jgi:glycosyltransferase involved in cell wall biosynthesis
MIITPAEGMKQMLESYGVIAPIRVIPNGTDIEKFQSVDGYKVRKLYGYSKDEIILLYVGRIAKEKNIEFLLRCMRQLINLSSNVRLLIVGDGPHRNHLIKQVKEWNLSRFVIFTGAVQYDSVPLYYNASDIFLLPSVTEVNSLSIIEALASGKPIVAVKSFNTLEVLIDGVNSLLTDYAEDSFVMGIMSLVKNDDLRETMSKEARRHAAKFSMKRQAGCLMNVYHEVLENVGKTILHKKEVIA